MGGCDEDPSCPSGPVSGVQLESIYLSADSVAIGGRVDLWALPGADDQQYSWTATGGVFEYREDNYALWKAPDQAALVRLTVTAVNDKTESKALGATIAVAVYLPRHTPAYTGASYCGLECHADHGVIYDTWVTTTHAQTFPATAEHPQYDDESCAACHTVGYGDVNAQGWDRHNGGYDEIQVARLEGVQCENCHGPMSDRFGNLLPGHASIGLNDSLYTPGTPEAPLGCGTCHEDYASAAHAQGKAYVSEWQSGAHAEIPAGVDLDAAACIRCHTARGFIALLDGRPTPMTATPQPITCVACHDPHGSDWAADLRRGPHGDVCSQCHTDQAQGYPTAPHAPQGQMLAGTGGVEEFLAGAALSTPHPNVIRRGCAECHYPGEEHGGSHSFSADPASCAGCHPVSSGADFAWAAAARGEIAALAATLDNELGGASAADSSTAVFRQAEFNLRFVLRDGSTGAHNHAYAKQLLESSIAAFEPAQP
ncbi:MAG: multiheme c-type cytochrome [Candidatus Eisenbacteria bacterium]